MKKNHQNDVVEKMKEFPDYHMSSSRQEKIYSELMDKVIKKERRVGRMEGLKRLSMGLASVAAVVLFVFLGMSFWKGDPNHNASSSNQHNQTVVQEQTPEQNKNPDKEKTSQENQVQKLDKASAKEVMIQYKNSMDIIVEEADINTGLITSFDSREDVKAHLEEVMSKEIATEMLETYIREQDGELYIIPRSGPIWLVEEADFELQQMNEQHYVIIQEQQNELIGHVEMSYQLKWQNGKWIVYKVDRIQLK